MDQVAQLEGRISTLSEFRDLIRGLQTMAAVHMQQAQSALHGARSYVETIEASIAESDLLLNERERQTILVGRNSKKVLLAIGSEHGFVGALNERLLDRIGLEALTGYELAIVGRRGEMLASERGVQCAWSVAAPANVDGIGAVARRVAARLRDAAVVRVIFPAHRRGAEYEIAAKTILPLESNLLKDSLGNHPPLHHLHPMELVHRLSEELLFAEVAFALVETLASENAARLQLMQSGDRNTSEKLDELTRKTRLARQEKITTELLDVIAGSEAVIEGQRLPINTDEQRF